MVAVLVDAATAFAGAFSGFVAAGLVFEDILLTKKTLVYWQNRLYLASNGQAYYFTEASHALRRM